MMAVTGENGAHERGRSRPVQRGIQPDRERKCDEKVLGGGGISRIIERIGVFFVVVDDVVVVVIVVVNRPAK